MIVVSTPFLTEQPVVDGPFETEYVKATFVVPPEVVKVKGVPKVPEVLVKTSGDCADFGTGTANLKIITPDPPLAPVVM